MPRSPRNGTVALALALLACCALVLSVVGRGVGVGAVFVGADSVAGNAFTTADCFSTQFQSVQRGTATNAVNGTTTVAITAVDPARSFLIFNTRHNLNRPVGSAIRGRIASATTLEFVRVTNESPVSTITIQWYVVQYACGVKVQRGDVAQSATTVNVPITAVSSMGRSFVLWSKSSAAGDNEWGDDDAVLGDLTSTTNLQFRAATANASHTISWQVVEFTMPGAASVQRGSTSLTGTTLSQAVTLPTAVDLSRAFVLTGVRSSGTGADVGARLVRARLTGTTTVTIDRSVSGTPDNLEEVSWQVVELDDGSVVQGGSAAFGAGAATVTAALTPVDPSLVAAFGSFQHGAGQNMGRTPYVTEDVLGVASATVEVTAANQVTLTRANTAAAADVGWFVVRWGADAGDPSVPVGQVQSQVAEGAPASATFGATPAAGNLLVAISFHRIDHTTPSINGSGWQLRVLRTTQLANTSARRGLAIWTKVAGTGEPTNVQTSWTGGAASPATNKLVLREFAASADDHFEFLAMASNDNDTTQNATSLATGTTASVTGSRLLLITALGIRNDGSTNINSASWTDGVNATVHSNGGASGRTVNSGFGEHATAGTKTSTASWTGNNGGASAAIMVFRVTTGTPWYDAAWTARKTVTVDEAQVPGSSALVNFPVLVGTTDAQVKAKARADGHDILFTADDGVTKLDHEIEAYDSGTGALLVWVRVPSLSATVNTVLYLYYGNAAAAAQENPAAVWNSDYVAVWHLKENPAGTAPQMLDSTANANHTDTNGASTTIVSTAAQVGQGLELPGGASADYVRRANTTSLDLTGNQFTLEAWVKSGPGGWLPDQDAGIISKAHAPSTNVERYHLGIDRLGKINVRRTSGGVMTRLDTNAGDLPEGQWIHIVGSYDGSTLKAYRNGVEMGSLAATGNIDASAQEIRIGARYDTRRFSGSLDELRISQVARSVDWIATTSNNQGSPSTFLAIGGEETPAP